VTAITAAVGSTTPSGAVLLSVTLAGGALKFDTARDTDAVIAFVTSTSPVAFASNTALTTLFSSCFGVGSSGARLTLAQSAAASLFAETWHAWGIVHSLTSDSVAQVLLMQGTAASVAGTYAAGQYRIFRLAPGIGSSDVATLKLRSAARVWMIDHAPCPYDYFHDNSAAPAVQYLDLNDFIVVPSVLQLGATLVSQFSSEYLGVAPESLFSAAGGSRAASADERVLSLAVGSTLFAYRKPVINVWLTNSDSVRSSVFGLSNSARSFGTPFEQLLASSTMAASSSNASSASSLVDVFRTLGTPGPAGVDSEVLLAMAQSRYFDPFVVANLTNTIDTTSGLSDLVFTPSECELRCETSVYATRLVQECPPIKSMRIKQVAALRCYDSAVDCDLKFNDREGFFEHLPWNYRPPSPLGHHVPTTRHIYNGHPGRAKYRDYMPAARQTGAFKRCAYWSNLTVAEQATLISTATALAEAEDIDDLLGDDDDSVQYDVPSGPCGCTRRMRASDSIEDSDCIDRVPRVYFTNRFTPQFEILMGGVLMAQHAAFELRLFELNNRTDWCVTGQTCSGKFDYSDCIVLHWFYYFSCVLYHINLQTPFKPYVSSCRPSQKRICAKAFLSIRRPGRESCGLGLNYTTSALKHGLVRYHHDCRNAQGSDHRELLQPRFRRVLFAWSVMADMHVRVVPS